MPYSPNARFADPARAKPELWRIPASAAVMMAGAAVLQMILLMLAEARFGPEGQDFVWHAVGGELPGTGATLLLLSSFTFFLAGLGLAVHAIHSRGLLSLFGNWGRLIPDTLRVSGACLLLAIPLTLFLPSEMVIARNPNLTGATWLLLLPISLPLIALQSGAEELFFRGYLQQQLAARFRPVAVSLVVPSILFALAHTGGGAGANTWLLALWAGAFGLAAADLTARTGTLGGALGLHFANNTVAFLLVAPQGVGSGLAFWLLPVTISDPAFGGLGLADFGMLLCLWLAARVALRV